MTPALPMATIEPMDRKILSTILDEAPGVTGADDGYSISDDHKASLYLAALGQTSVITELSTVVLSDGYVSAHQRNGTIHSIEYDRVFGFAVRPPREDGPRTGF